MALHVFLCFAVLPRLTASLSAQQVYTFTDFFDASEVQLAAGSPFTCHANTSTSTNALTCWSGRDWRNAERIALPSIVQVACSSSSCCGIQLSPAGRISCWSLPGGEPVTVVNQSDQVLQVAMGDGYVCGITVEDEIKCWGDHAKKIEEAAKDVAGGAPLVQLSCSQGFCCVLHISGLMQCFGQLPSAVREPPEVRLKQVSCSKRGSHVVGITMSGEFFCWGDNAFGQCKNPHNRRFIKLVAGERFTCGLTHERSLLCWGKTPRMDNVDQYAFDDIAGGERHVCGVLSASQPSSDKGIVCFT